MERDFENRPETVERSPLIKGSLRECWRKDLRTMGLEGLQPDLESVKIALAAQRIVFATRKELHIYNFDGTREGSIKLGDQISSMDVTSDCSRILVSLNRLGTDIVAYNPKGSIELKTKLDFATTAAGIVRTSQDGSLFGARSNNRMELWDWHGNKLLSFYAPGMLLEAQQYYGFDIAPNAKYIAISQGLHAPDGLFIGRIPRTDDLLKISDFRERMEIIIRELEQFVFWPEWRKDKPPENCFSSEGSTHWNVNSLSFSNNRLAVRSGDRSVVYIDIDSKSRVVPFHQDLVEKPEYIESFKMTSSGRYLYYTTRRGKSTSFNIFDTKEWASMRDLLTFQEGSRTRAYFYPSHDGTRLILVEVISKGMLSRDIMISMLNVE